MIIFFYKKFEYFKRMLNYLMIFYNYSLFGRAFEQAAKNTNCYIEADYFDTTSMLCFF